MSFPDETLMAYADGELDPALAARVEQAMRTDPAVAQAVERHRLLRKDVFGAFAGVLDEPVPERLLPRMPAAANEGANEGTREDGATVHSLAARRAARAQAAPRPAVRPRWGALAASLAVGVLAGALGWRAFDGQPQSPFARQDGMLVARGALADTLSHGLASAQTQKDAVRLGVSFQAKDGSYCRSFALGATGGLACREKGQWRVPVLAEGVQEGGDYRRAGSATPDAVLDAIDQRIAGPALDAPAERAARDRDWQGRK
jgi:hypothetical protein